MQTGFSTSSTIRYAANVLPFVIPAATQQANACHAKSAKIVSSKIAIAFVRQAILMTGVSAACRVPLNAQPAQEAPLHVLAVL